MGGHGHDGAGAVGRQNVVGDEDGDLLVVDRVDAHNAFQLDAGLFLVQLTALEVALAGSLSLIGLNGIRILDDALFQPLLDHGVLRRDDHVGSAEQGIAAGGVHGQGVPGGGAEVHFCAVAAADPVLLLGGHALDVIQAVQAIDQLIGISGDLEHPLALDAVHHLAAAALAHAVDNFLVGQHALAAGAPVDVHFLLVSQTVLVQLQEDPLGPLVVLGVGGVDLTVPVEGEAQSLQLLAEVVHIVLGDDGRVDVVLHGEVLGGQTEGIPAHGVEHVVAVLTALAAHHVQRGIAAGVAHVQTRARRIRELHEGIELGLFVVDLGMEGLLVLPHLLPLGLNGLVIILHCFQLQTFLMSNAARRPRKGGRTAPLTLQTIIRRQILRDVDGLAVGPQVLQIVVGAGVGHEHMHDDVRVVQQDPVLRVEALGAQRLDALLGKLELHLVGQRTHLRGGGAGRDDEVIGQDGQALDLEYPDVLCFFLIKDLRDLNGKRLAVDVVLHLKFSYLCWVTGRRPVRRWWWPLQRRCRR